MYIIYLYVSSIMYLYVVDVDIAKNKMLITQFPSHRNQFFD